MSTIGLRERKKSETRRVIADAALQLALDHGPDAVTVEDIAAAADVSPRTVFNHFGTKDEAILGIDADRRAAFVGEVANRPAHETPVEAIRAGFVQLLTTSEDRARFWRARAELVAQHPRLRAAQVVSQAALEQELAAAIAARTGLDVDRDQYPLLLATVSLSALRFALVRAAEDGPAALRREIRTALAALAGGLVPPSPRTTDR